MSPVLTRRVELEPRHGHPGLPGLDPEHELRVDEPLAAVVEPHRIHHVAERVVHARRDERVIVSVRIEVADARSPWTVILRVDGIGHFAKLPWTFLEEERVAPDARRAIAAERLGPLNRRLLLLSFGTNHLAHVGVHVGDENVQASVVVEVEDFDAHRPPRGPWEDITALPDEALAAGILVILIVPLHVQHIQIEPAVIVDVERARVA